MQEFQQLILVENAAPRTGKKGKRQESSKLILTLDDRTDKARSHK